MTTAWVRGHTPIAAVLEEMRNESIASTYVQTLVEAMTARQNATRGRARELLRDKYEVEGRELMRSMGVKGYTD